MIVSHNCWLSIRIVTKQTDLFCVIFIQMEKTVMRQDKPELLVSIWTGIAVPELDNLNCP